MKITEQTLQEFNEEHEEFNRKRERIRKLNDALIEKWNSIPWWNFWDRPSYEYQRDTIIRNWRSVDFKPVDFDQL